MKSTIRKCIDHKTIKICMEYKPYSVKRKHLWWWNYLIYFDNDTPILLMSMTGKEVELICDILNTAHAEGMIKATLLCDGFDFVTKKGD